MHEKGITDDNSNYAASILPFQSLLQITVSNIGVETGIRSFKIGSG